MEEQRGREGDSEEWREGVGRKRENKRELADREGGREQGGRGRDPSAPSDCRNLVQKAHPAPLLLLSPDD